MKVYRSRKSGLAIRESYDRLLAFWSCETKERDVATAYGTTHVIECGKAESLPLVLFHGVGDDSALMWIYNAPELSKHFHLYAIDTLGGPGKSVPNENTTRSLTTYAGLMKPWTGWALGKRFTRACRMAVIWYRHIHCCAPKEC